MWVYYKLFQPVMHVVEKVMEGEKVRAPRGMKLRRLIGAGFPPAS
jgi:hypothetical protein